MSHDAVVTKKDEPVSEPPQPIAAPLTMVERPDDPDLISRARLQATLEETLLPSPNSIDLQRTPSLDYMLRFAARGPHIAELFQENTKLSPHASLRVPDDERQLDFARAWFFSTAYKMDPFAIVPGREAVVMPLLRTLPEPLARMLSVFSRRGPASSLLYANDLFVLHDLRVYRVLPESEAMWAERRLTPSEMDAFRAAILRQPPEVVKTARAFLVVAAAPWRYMMFLGPRGYRHVLFEAGSLVGQLQYAAIQVGLQAARCFDFYDARIDQIMLFDGVERTTLAIIALEGTVL